MTVAAQREGKRRSPVGAETGLTGRLGARVKEWRQEQQAGLSPATSLGETPFVFDNFQINASMRKLLSFGVSHDDQACTTGTDISFYERNGPGPRREPLLEQVGFCPGSEELFWWCINNSLEYKVSVRTSGLAGNCHGMLQKVMVQDARRLPNEPRAPGPIADRSRSAGGQRLTPVLAQSGARRCSTPDRSQKVTR